MSENSSDSIEQDELIKKIITYKFKSNRPNSQLFPKTPDIKAKPILKSLNPSKKSSPLTSPKPRSNKSSAMTPNNINLISKKTSQEIIRSIYTLVSSTLPMTICESSELSTKDQEEIQTFFIQQKAKFKKTLENLTKKDKTQQKFVGHSKSMKIIESKHMQEVKRLKDKQKLVKKDLLKKTSERILKEKTVAKKTKEIEVNRKRNEEKKIQSYEKDLIMKNIENFYKDKTNQVKDYLRNELERNKVKSLEEKYIASEIIKEMKMSNSKKFSELKLKYELEIERLKEKFNNIH